MIRSMNLNGGNNQNPNNNQTSDYNSQPYNPQDYQSQYYQQPDYNRQPEQSQPYEYAPQYTDPKQKNDGKAIASMILGIVSLVSCGGFLACPIVGLVLGIVSKKERPEKNSMAVAGIVMCSIALVFTLIYFILMFCVIIPRTYNFNY